MIPTVNMLENHELSLWCNRRQGENRSDSSWQPWHASTRYILDTTFQYAKFLWHSRCLAWVLQEESFSLYAFQDSLNDRSFELKTSVLYSVTFSVIGERQVIYTQCLLFLSPVGGCEWTSCAAGFCSEWCRQGEASRFLPGVQSDGT